MFSAMLGTARIEESHGYVVGMPGMGRIVLFHEDGWEELIVLYSEDARFGEAT
jgi:hypothetical protein